MQIFKYIFALYIFFGLILAALAFAVSLSFGQYANYAYSVALVLHSVAIFWVFIDALKEQTKQKGKR